MGTSVVGSMIHAFIARTTVDTSVVGAMASVSASVRTRDTGRAVARAVEVTAIPAVVHAEVVSVRDTIAIPVSIVVAISAMNMPGVSAMIGGIEMWTPEVEEVTLRIAGIDTEVPVTCIPVERTVEITGCDIGIPLPVEQYIAQVEVATLPIGSENVSSSSDSHQVVEIDLISGLILLVGQIQLVCHLICQEQCLVTGLLIAHCTCCHRVGQHHQQCEKHLLHNRIFLIVRHSFSFSRCKVTSFSGLLQRIFPKQTGEKPYKCFFIDYFSYLCRQL